MSGDWKKKSQKGVTAGCDGLKGPDRSIRDTRSSCLDEQKFLGKTQHFLPSHPSE